MSMCGMDFWKSLSPRHEPQGREGRQHGDLQLTAHPRPGNPLGFLFQDVERVTDSGMIPAARVCQRHTTASSSKQGNAQKLLEDFHLLANRAFRNSEFVCCTNETLLFRGHLEVANCFQGRNYASHSLVYLFNSAEFDHCSGPVERQI